MTTYDSTTETNNTDAEEQDGALAAGIADNFGHLANALTVAQVAKPVVTRLMDSRKRNQADEVRADLEPKKDADDAERGTPHSDA